MPVLTLAAFTALAIQCAPGNSPLTLAAISHAESRFNSLATLDNTTRTSRLFQDVETAIRVTSGLIADGHSVDVGIMQINSRNFPSLGLSVADAFDACRSIQAGAKVLAGSYLGGATPAAQQAALTGAISAYNTGSKVRGIENGYVQRVQASAALLIPEIEVRPGAASAKASASTSAAPPPPPPPAPQPPLCAPSWDAWALASCSARPVATLHQSKGNDE